MNLFSNGKRNYDDEEKNAKMRELNAWYGISVLIVIGIILLFINGYK